MAARISKQARARWVAQPANIRMVTLDQLAEGLVSLKPNERNKLDRTYRKAILAELARRGWQGVRRY